MHPKNDEHIMNKVQRSRSLWPHLCPYTVHKWDIIGKSFMSELLQIGFVKHTVGPTSVTLTDLVSCCVALFSEWTNTRQTDRRLLAHCWLRAPTVLLHGTTGNTPSEVATARPAYSTTPMARKGTMYVRSSTLLPHPHPPPTHCNGIYHGPQMSLILLF